jgi:hypothetical protein
MNSPVPEQLPPAAEQMSLLDRSKQAALGLGLAALAFAGAYGVANHIDGKLAVTTDSAQPSDGLSDAFDAAVAGLVAVGVAATAKRAYRHIYVSVSAEQAALNEMAHASSRFKSSVGRAVLGGSLVVVGSGALMGSFVDTAHEVSHSQSNVANFFTDILGKPAAGQDNFVISNSPRPELANNTNVSVDKANKFMTSAAQNNVSVIPANWEWHAAQRNGSPDAKIQVLAASLPARVANLPIADAKCDNISVAAAQELGVAKGETFTMDGLTLTVREVLDGKSGMNLLPVLFNSEDFGRCIRNNPDQPFTAMLAQGDKEQIKKILGEQGLSAENMSNRAFVVPTSEFIENSQKTGENSVNPLVLQALAVASLITGAAVGSRASRRLTENRRSNTVLRANGMSWHQVRTKEVETAESESMISSVWALPVVVLIDAATNGGIPGAALGPGIETMLCVVGANWLVNRSGTAIALRREARKENLAKGQRL